MTKIVKFTKNDLIGGVVFNVGDVAGFDEAVAEKLIKREFAVLEGDGRPKKVGEKLPPGRGEFGFEEPKGGRAA